jgi:AMMECR1 domain-containing protein
MKNPHKIETSLWALLLPKAVLKIAREAIAYYVQQHRTPRLSRRWSAQEKRGVFVTLTEGGECAAARYQESDRPLYELVPDRAIAAAFDDPPFHLCAATSWIKSKSRCPCIDQCLSHRLSG